MSVLSFFLPLIPPCWTFLFGAVIGSFLNVCIYRIPEGISLSNPPRSFCPHCKTTILWYHNIPIISYFWLRGRCSNCSTHFSARYPLVEAITATLFTAIWATQPTDMLAFYWLMVSILIVVSFIDCDHLKTPNKLTLGGAIFAFVLSCSFPSLMGEDSSLRAGTVSLLGAAAGGIFWLLALGGNFVFGEKLLAFTPSRSFVWKNSREGICIDFGGESFFWKEVFIRDSDFIALDCLTAKIPNRPLITGTILFNYDSLTLPDGSRIPLPPLNEFCGYSSSMLIHHAFASPGTGAFLVMIGAFLGWQPAIFALVGALILGGITASIGAILSNDRPLPPLPSAPFLAFGATFWLMGHPIFPLFFGWIGVLV